VSDRSISLYEKAVEKPTITTLTKLTEALEVSTDYLVEITDDPQPYRRKV
jgi:transcriptional regulator with XRE-family HTH domain